MGRMLVAIGCLLALLAPPLSASGPEGVVLLPLADLSGVDGGAAFIAPAIAGALSAKGYRVVEGGAVEEFLEAERIRYVDSLSAPARGRLLERFGASAVLVGTLFTLHDGDIPAVAVLLRLIRADGRLAWERLGALSADETEGLMGLGRLSSLDEVVGRVARRLESSLPAPGATASPAPARARPFGRSGPRTFRSGALAPGKTYRVVVLPFENLSRDQAAPKLVAALAAYRLRASGQFEVVEPAELRAAVVAAGVRSVTSPDPVELRKLTEKLGTSLFLTGTVYASNDGSTTGGAGPEFELDLALVDASRSRVVWSSHHARKGRDYQGVLELGAISSLPVLTDQVVAEMVAAAERAKPGKPEKS